MEGVITSVTFHRKNIQSTGQKWLILVINFETYMMQFIPKEFEQLNSLKVNDKIIVRSHSADFSNNNPYLILSSNYIAKDNKVVLKRILINIIVVKTQLVNLNTRLVNLNLFQILHTANKMLKQVQHDKWRFSFTKQQTTNNKQTTNSKFQIPNSKNQQLKTYKEQRTMKIENRITKIELPVAEAKLKMKKNSKIKNLARFYLYF